MATLPACGDTLLVLTTGIEPRSMILLAHANELAIVEHLVMSIVESATVNEPTRKRDDQSSKPDILV